MLPQATSLLIDKGGNRLRNWNLKKERDSFQTTLGGIRPHPSRAAPRHTWQKRETVGIFQFLMRCFFELFHGVVSESPQREWSTSAGTPGFFLPEIPAESALIITASLPPPPPTSEVETERATAGGEELGFKQYRLQEVQPSLLVVDSDINSNEYLGALPDCLSTNRYGTAARALKVGFVCASLCVIDHVSGPACDHVMHTPLCTCTSSHIAECECAPLLGPDMSNMQNSRQPKNDPGWQEQLIRTLLVLLDEAGASCWGYTCTGLELRWDPAMIFKWSMAGRTTFISSKCFAWLLDS